MRRPHSGFVRALVVPAALSFALLTPLSAAAQTDEQRAAARSLATDGATAFNEGRWKDAVDLFTRAESLVHAPPHLLFLARSYEKLGRYVQARETYLKITRESLPPSAPQAFRDAQSAAVQELRAVEPRVASLTIQVQGAESAPDLQVLLDGAPIPTVLVGVARPTDPGDHKVEAAATGFRAQPLSVRLGEGEKKSLSLVLVKDPSATPLPAPGALPSRAGEPGALAPKNPPTVELSGPPPAPENDGSNGLRIGSYVAFGVGVVGLGVGTVFLLDSRSKRKDADSAFESCNASGDCRENDALARKTKQLDDDARSAMTLSIVGYSVGAVGIAAGTALLFASSGKKHEELASALVIRPFIGWNEAGVSGRF